MAHRLPPTRIAVDPQASQVLRAMVNHARADLPNAATLSRLAARVDTAIAANVPVPEIAATSGAASSALGLKLLGATLIAGAMAGGAVYWLRDKAPTAISVPSSAVASATSLDVTAPLQTTKESTPASEDSAGDDSATPSATDLSPVPRRPVVRDGATEVSLLDSARTKLRTDPNRALELTREHARRFPNGALVQEREVIAIEALRRLGKSDAAKKRGEDFSQHYPDSAHQSKIEQTLKGN